MDLDTLLHTNALRMMMCDLGAHVIESNDLADYAVEYAVRGWTVFPLRYDKSPATRHGMLDATDNLAQIAQWWSDPYRGASIGIRLPPSVFVLDIDPRNGGLPQWKRLINRYGHMPDTLTSWSGRGDGGRHYYMRRLDNGETKLSTRGLVQHLTTAHDPWITTGEKLGIDVKTHSGYVVAPPSPHPATGRPYRWEHDTVQQCPEWLWYWLTQGKPQPPRPVVPHDYDDDSPADWFTAHASWRQILEPHGWDCVGYDGDSDGSMWRHPAATSSVSATVRNGCLFVYSPNTPFEITEAGMPYGYTRFKAFAVLNFGGDMSAAAATVTGYRRMAQQ